MFMERAAGSNAPHPEEILTEERVDTLIQFGRLEASQRERAIGRRVGDFFPELWGGGNFRASAPSSPAPTRQGGETAAQLVARADFQRWARKVDVDPQAYAENFVKRYPTRRWEQD